MLTLSNNLKTKILRVSTALGTVALLGLGMYLGTLVAPYLPNTASRVYSTVVYLSGTFKRNTPLTLSSDKLTLASDDIFTLSWNDAFSAEEGTYSLSYDCNDGISFTLPENEKVFACNTPFTVTKETQHITLKVVSKKNELTNLPLTLSFTKKGDLRVAGTSHLLLLVNNLNTLPLSLSDENDAPKIQEEPSASKQTITFPNTHTTKVKETPKNSPLAPTGPKTEKVYAINPTQNIAPSGNADLTATILEVGILDKNTNAFTATTTLHASDRIGIHFIVENKGGKASGDWSFNAVLPTYPSYIFQSDSQTSLAPLDRIEFTLGFDRIENKNNNTVIINIDPTNSINESNKDNNIVRTVIDGVNF